MAQNECMRRAPLEESRNGQGMNHGCFHLIANRLSNKRVNDLDPADDLAVLQVFGQQNSAAGLLCRVKN